MPAPEKDDRPRLGIVMLDTRFPRIPGDIGNPDTWPFAVRYRVVAGATAQGVVLNDAGPFLTGFVAAGRALVAEGCVGIATSCGFLVALQDRLTDALGVPVATSALLQVPAVQATLPAGQDVGVVTISAARLTARHRASAGMTLQTPCVGTDEDGDSAFNLAILGDAPQLDVAAARSEVVRAAERLVARYPEVGAIVLECTNMAPYAPDVQQATGRPVFSIYTYLTWFHGALAPPRFDGAPP